MDVRMRKLDEKMSSIVKRVGAAVGGAQKGLVRTIGTPPRVGV